MKQITSISIERGVINTNVVHFRHVPLCAWKFCGLCASVRSFLDIAAFQPSCFYKSIDWARYVATSQFTFLIQLVHRDYRASTKKNRECTSGQQGAVPTTVQVHRDIQALTRETSRSIGTKRAATQEPPNFKSLFVSGIPCAFAEQVSRQKHMWDLSWNPTTKAVGRQEGRLRG